MMTSIPWPVILETESRRRPSPITWSSRPMPASRGEKRSGSSLARLLLPTVNRAGYEQMLNDFIVVANLLQPGPNYGTTAQDDAAWAVAMNASNINVS